MDNSTRSNPTIVASTEEHGLGEEASYATVPSSAGAQPAGVRQSFSQISQNGNQSKLGMSVSSATAAANSSKSLGSRLAPSTTPSPLAPSVKLGWLQRFYDLPIVQKTRLLTGLIGASVVIIVGMGSLILFRSLSEQVDRQVKSQLEVTELNYEDTLEGLTLGAVGYANNPVIVSAVQNAAQSLTVSAQTREQLSGLLDKEARLRELEYATIVDQNLKIIANANTPRAGEIFNPSGLVAQAVQNQRQLKSTELIPWTELLMEAPDLPENVREQDILTRFAIAPIRTPQSNQVIGAVIFGKIVNDKDTLVKRTVEAFQGQGYSAIYFLDPLGNPQLATSFEQTETRGTARNKGLSENSQILSAALDARGKPIAQETQLEDGQQYIIAAKALPNAAGEQIAIFLYGDPNTALDRMRSSLLAQVGLSIAVLIALVLISERIGLTITTPILRLQKITQDFSDGNYHGRAIIDANDEVGQLAGNFNQMAASIEVNNQRTRQESEIFRLLAELTGTRELDRNVLDELTATTVERARQIIQADRVAFYHFTLDGSGNLVHEAYVPGSPSIRDISGEEAILPGEFGTSLEGGVLVEDELQAEDFGSKKTALLKQLKVQSLLAVPILSQEQLYGVLVAHHCQQKHQWTSLEINFFRQLADQLRVVVDRLVVREQRNAQSYQAQILKDITLQLSQVKDLNSLFTMIAEESRRALAVERVIVYRIPANQSRGEILTQVTSAGHFQLQEPDIARIQFTLEELEQYQSGQLQAITNLEESGLTSETRQLLASYSVKAQLIVPIFVAQEFYGSLIAHHCIEPHNWLTSEIDFFAQLSTQVGVALERDDLLNQQRIASEEQRQAKEKLQRRALELLMEVDPVSQGDLTVRAQVTSDEIGTIADSYNATIENLRKIVSQVKIASEQVADTTSNNEAAIQTLSAEADLQAVDINGALSRIETMTASIQAVATNAKKAELSVTKATQSLNTGDRAMNRTVSAIQTIRETVVEAANKVQRLGEESQKISQVVNLISRFAAQTHLLALKASIEAARAGDEGRGFAVIADEVRSLAAQSAEASADIESMVASIQAETNEVVAAMEAGTEQVAMGTQLVDETRLSLTQITEASLQINQLVEEIALAAVQQSQSSQSVTQAMTNVAAIAQNTSSSASHVATSFKELLLVAQALQQDVAQFKVT